MDPLVTQFYRKLVRHGFEYAGSLDNPSIFLDSVGEKIRICGGSISNYLHIYIQISDYKVTDIKYLCLCDPTANVVVELLCGFLKGMTLEPGAEDRCGYLFPDPRKRG